MNDLIQYGTMWERGNHRPALLQAATTTASLPAPREPTSVQSRSWTYLANDQTCCLASAWQRQP